MIFKRSIQGTTGVGDYQGDFLKVRDFLRQFQKDAYTHLVFPWGRWEWMFSLPYFDTTFIHKIYVWEKEEQIVALATYESSFGEGYYVIHPSCEYLKAEVGETIINEYMHLGKVRMLIPNQDALMQRIARQHGLVPTSSKEEDALFDLDQTPLEYELPEGFEVVSLKDDFSLLKYHNVLWKGFGHSGEVENMEELLPMRKVSLSGIDVNLAYLWAVRSQTGEFVSYCGMWYIPNDHCALVEPVATDPEFRKMGLGKACVLSALARVKQDGAKVAIVGSSQEFYYKIGFSPLETSTWWEKTSGNDSPAR
ncbi:MAG: GNAT family N-acetyltransferase [Candidatus Izemoplasmatales bacterium]|jgi:GNAT superfamily N-acetyltransferase|nr:GNAT family N-acetyltransferase [bacterium]MDZ4196520.1 GNAT family N-acetyltransferase [Candidatus Izemoplasmatales bacterium]